MSYAELKAASDGRGAVVEASLRGMIKAGKTSLIESLIGGAAGGAVNNFQTNYQRQNRAREAYRLLRNWVYSATSVVAKRCAGQPWMAGHYEQREENPSKGRRYSKDLIPRGVLRSRKSYGTADIDPDPNHDVLWLLDKPNKVQGRFEFVNITVMNLLLTGEWYWIGGVNGKGEVECWAIPSSWITPDHSKGIYGGYKLQTGYGEGIPIPPENVARGYFPDPSDIKGCLSPLAMCSSAAKIDDYILSSQEATFERGINPNLVITIGERIGPDGRPVQGSRPTLTGQQRRQLIRSVRHVWSNTVSQGDPAILDGLIKDIHKLQATPQEMDWKQSGEVVKARIYQAYSVNPIVTGEVTPANKAQAIVAEQQVCTNSVNPILENISCAASEFFSQFYDDGETLAVWLERAIPKDEEREDKQWSQARQQGDVTQDEVRGRMNLEPLKEEPKRSPLFNNPQILTAISALAAQVSAGAIPHDEAAQILVTTLQISKKDADAMLPDDPPEPTPDELAAQQAMALGGAGGQPGPAAGNGQKPPPAKPKPAKPPKEEPEKTFDASQPRNPDGTWGSGGSAADAEWKAGDGSGAQGTSPEIESGEDEAGPAAREFLPLTKSPATKIARHMVKAAHAAQHARVERQAARKLTKYFQKSVRQITANLFAAEFTPKPDDAKAQAHRLIIRAYDKDAQGNLLVNSAAPVVADGFVEGAAAEMRLTAAARRRKAFDPDQPRNPDGTWGAGGSLAAESIQSEPTVAKAESLARVDELAGDEPFIAIGGGEHGLFRATPEGFDKRDFTRGWPEAIKAGYASDGVADLSNPPIATQTSADTRGVKMFIRNPTIAEDAGDDRPMLVKYNGDFYVGDGHTRLTAMRISGVAEARVLVLDLDRYREDGEQSDDSPKVVGGKGVKVTTATQAAERAEEEIDFPTELPDWLRESAQDFVLETFQEDYWLRIPETTRDDIELTLYRAIEDGLSIRDIAEEIQERHGGAYSKARATMVARTEALSAMNAGHTEGIRQAYEGTGVEPAKEWLSIMGTTTRDEHAEADGQQVPVDEPFTVGGEQCMFPGDASLSAGMRINCQCTILSAFVGEGLSDDEEGKAFNPDQPRDESGRWAGGGATFFHGGLVENVESMLKDGIQVGEANYDETKAGYVYVADTEHEALYWAKAVAFDTGKGDSREVALLEVRIPSSARRRVSADENLPEEHGSFKFKGTIKPEWIVSAKVGTLENYKPLVLENERKIKEAGEGEQTIWVAVVIPQDDDDEEAKSFDPSQPRDESGRWSSTGGGGTDRSPGTPDQTGSLEVGKYPPASSITPELSRERFDHLRAQLERHYKESYDLQKAAEKEPDRDKKQALYAKQREVSTRKDVMAFDMMTYRQVGDAVDKDRYIAARQEHATAQRAAVEEAEAMSQKLQSAGVRRVLVKEDYSKEIPYYEHEITAHKIATAGGYSAAGDLDKEFASVQHKYPALTRELWDEARAVSERTMSYNVGTKETERYTHAYYGEPEELQLKSGDLGAVNTDAMPPRTISGNGSEDLRSFMRNAEIAIQVKDTPLDRIISSGEFKTRMAGGVQGVSAKNRDYKTARVKGEEELFGIPEDADPSARPAYGYLEHADRTLSSGGVHGSNYGGNQIVLKDSIKERATFVVGDSLDDRRHFKSVASPVNDPQLPPQIESNDPEFHLANNSRDWRVTQHEPYGPGSKNTLRPRYIEAQVWGGIKLDDIAEIRIPKGRELKPAQEKKLAKAGVRVRIVPPPIKASFYAPPDSWDAALKPDTD